MENGVSVRELAKENIPEALALVRRVFREYESLDYTVEGIAEFERSIRDEGWLSQLRLWGGYTGGKPIGVIATRSVGTHIALFFVDGRFHRQGVGRQLFETALAACPSDTMTVNSSPYAVPVYRALGFRETAAEQNVNGLRFTPMAFRKSGE